VKAEFAEVLDDIRPDVVCLGTLHTNYWLAPVARARHIPVVFYIHGEEACGIRRSRLNGDGPKTALLQANSCIAVSRFTRNALLGLGVADSRVHVITNGVDIRRFRPGPKDPGLIAHYGLAGKRVLMTLARLDERKGHDRVIQALPAILRAQPDTVYVIVGTGEMKERLVKLAREMNISDHVVFTGQIADQAVAEHYRMCDVFIMPNRTLEDGDTEGFGLVFLEAGACARPVIGGNAGGVADAIDHQKTGLLVDGNSVDQIACAAATLIGDCDLCRKMGEAGLQKAASSDWVAKASQFEEIMAHVISRP
jgi:phosphatidylinositol alpha-1,6-mannosyltransferase